MEVLGGIGYCEESELPRLYREMPVNRRPGAFPGIIPTVPGSRQTKQKRGLSFKTERHLPEVLGGIGYCEESELPRLYREMPVNSIWEGSGNIMRQTGYRPCRWQTWPQA
jgi:alkylation response protein AidB-like acyl-CoA dehydrogenase